MSAIISLGMHLLVWLFFIGLAGSASVIFVSFVQDLHELFGK